MKARLPQGYGKSAANPADLMKKAQQMQLDMQAKQAELEETEFSSTSGGGAVEVTVTGKKEVRSIHIKPEVVDPEDVEMLEDLLTAAVNEALRKAEETTSAEMEKITGALNLPGMPGLF